MFAEMAAYFYNDILQNYENTLSLRSCFDSNLFKNNNVMVWIYGAVFLTIRLKVILKLSIFELRLLRFAYTYYLEYLLLAPFDEYEKV